MFTFITKRPFWVNLLAAVAIAFLIGFLFLQLLSWITKHGEYLTVPSVVGKNTDEAIKFLDKQGFDVVIQDSIYIDTIKNGTVIKQLPDPNSTVKINRTVFLTVNCYIPPLITMPRLEGLTLSYALNVLKRSHLTLKDTIFKPHFQDNSILEQQVNGTIITPGSKVRWGTAITLIVGRFEKKEMIVPDFYGMKVNEAQVILDSTGILRGALLPYQGVELQDTMNAFIIKQSVERFNDQKQPNYINSGQILDFYISPVLISRDSINNNTTIKEE